MMLRPLYLLLLLSAFALAQSRPATQDSAPLQIKITGVEGMVQVRDAEDKPWRKAAVGDVVGEGAEFRTGPRSAVRCEIPPDQTITIDRLGTVKVLKALQEQGKIKTDVAMKYGRTRYDIEEAGLEHESTIRSPNGSLALRGTRVSFYDQPPFAPTATSLTGRAVYANAKRRINVGSKGGGKAAVQEGEDSAAERAEKVAQVEKTLDAKSAIELTEAEARQLIFEVVDGGIRYDRLIVGGFGLNNSGATKPFAPPGKLNFVANWDGFADIDLFVIVNPNSPNQRILGNPSVSRLFGEGKVQSKLPSGATIDFDKISVGAAEFEIAYWPKANYGPGTYGIGIIHQDYRALDPKYSAVSNIRLEAYINGDRIDTILINPEQVRDGATPVFGDAYQAKTNLNEGRDVLSTIAIIPPVEGTQRNIKKTESTKAKSRPKPPAVKPSPAKPAPVNRKRTR